MSFIQELAHGNANGTGPTVTWTINLSATPSASNRVVVTFRTPSGALNSVTDTQGNTWTVVSTSFSSVANSAIAWTDQDVGHLVSGNTLTFTLSASTSTASVLEVLEYSGLGAMRTSANAHISPAATTGTISTFPETAGDTVICMVGGITGVVTGFPAGFTARGTGTSSPAPADLTVGSTGSQNLTDTWTSSVLATMLAVAFEPSGASASSGLLAFC